LAELLEDPDCRAEAAFTLGVMGQEVAIPVLIEALGGASYDALARADMAFSLGELGSATEPVLMALSEALADPSPWVRLCAASALEKLGHGEVAVEALLKEFGDEDCPLGRESAATILGRIGPGARPAIPALTLAVHAYDEDIGVRIAAAAALETIDPPDSRPPPSAGEGAGEGGY
jgi:HEAT repeat protein